MFRTYEMIIPLRSGGGRGFQENVTLVGDKVILLKFPGGLMGTERLKNNSKQLKINLLDITIPPSLSFIVLGGENGPSPMV